MDKTLTKLARIDEQAAKWWNERETEIRADEREKIISEMREKGKASIPEYHDHDSPDDCTIMACEMEGWQRAIKLISKKKED